LLNIHGYNKTFEKYDYYFELENFSPEKYEHKITLDLLGKWEKNIPIGKEQEPHQIYMSSLQQSTRSSSNLPEIKQLSESSKMSSFTYPSVDYTTQSKNITRSTTLTRPLSRHLSRPPTISRLQTESNSSLN